MKTLYVSFIFMIYYIETLYTFYKMTLKYLLLGFKTKGMIKLECLVEIFSFF